MKTSCEGCHWFSEPELKCFGLGNFHLSYEGQAAQISYVVTSEKLCGPTRKWYKKVRQRPGYGSGFVPDETIDTTGVEELWRKS